MQHRWQPGTPGEVVLQCRHDRGPFQKVQLHSMSSFLYYFLGLIFLTVPVLLHILLHQVQVLFTTFCSTVLHDNTLKIKKTTKIDSGYYQCFASNVLGETFVAYYVNVTGLVD